MFLICISKPSQKGTTPAQVFYKSIEIFNNFSITKPIPNQSTIIKTYGAQPLSIKNNVEMFSITLFTCLTASSCDEEKSNNNDPSAGSPTDTLLRLLLPLNDTI